MPLSLNWLIFVIADQQICDHRYPYLRHYRVDAVADKAFDFQVLLDGLKEDFDFPSCLVNVSDGLGIQVIGIGDISEINSGK